MKRTRIANLLLVLLPFPGGAVAQPRGEVALRAAMDTETVKGDLKGAIGQYEKIAQGSDRALAAKALLRMAGCYTKLGDAQAETIYHRVLRDYADQTASTNEARQRLAALRGANPSETLVKRLVCECGDSQSSLSPDGRWMVMTGWHADGDLLIRDMTNGQETRLMAKKAAGFQSRGGFGEAPILSPDLRQVVFHLLAGPPRSIQLRVMATEPGGKSRLLIDSSENRYYLPAAWSADAKSVLVTLQKYDRTWQLAWVSPADGSVKVLKSLEWRLRPPDSMVRLSPDGRFIAYTALTSNPRSATAPPESTDQRIYLLAADGSTESELVKSAGISKNPVWTPDGKHLLFTSDWSGTQGLWSIPMKNGKAAGSPSLVSGQIGDISALGMTRSGTYYYVPRRQEVEYTEVVEMPQAGSRSPKFKARFAGIRATWSPDGKLLAFTRRRPPTSGRNYDLVVHSIEDGEEKVYSVEGLLSRPPAWSQDGKTVIVPVGNSGTTRSLYRVDLKTREFTQVPGLDPAVLAGGAYALSADGKTLYFSERTPTAGEPTDRILAMDVGTGRRKEIFNEPSAGGPPVFFRLSPDSRTIASVRLDPRDKQGHFARVSIDGSGYRELYIVPPHTLGSIDVMAGTDNGAILFQEQQAGSWRVMRIPSEGGMAESIGLQGKGNVLSIDTSPDGSRIAYSTVSRVSELWALDNVLSVLQHSALK